MVAETGENQRDVFRSMLTMFVMVVLITQFSQFSFAPLRGPYCDDSPPSFDK